MTSVEAIKTLLAVIGVIVTVPLLMILFRVGQFFGALKTTLTSLQSTAAEFSKKVNTCLEDYGSQLADHETRLVVLERPYDGPEKRHAQRPYPGPDKRHAGPERSDETGG
jgi:hypothetical protein